MEWDAEIKGKNTPSDSDRVPWDEEEELTILPPAPPPVIEDLEIQREERNARLRSRAMELITQSGGFCLPIAKRRTEFTPEETKLQPELIKGLLRRGHKMILSGASKSGKSFMLVELALSLATGNKWVGFTCKRCKVCRCYIWIFYNCYICYRFLIAKIRVNIKFVNCIYYIQ